MLNSITIKNRYPLPLILELVNKLWGAKYFTKLNVQWGYNNIQIREEDKWKAAFWCNHRLFEPMAMIFELTNSSGIFQAMVNEIFVDLIAENKVCVYINDILIYSADLAEHHWITDMVLSQLRKHKLYLKLDKCEFKQ
jgi:hypothetical protein